MMPNDYVKKRAFHGLGELSDTPFEVEELSQVEEVKSIAANPIVSKNLDSIVKNANIATGYDLPDEEVKKTVDTLKDPKKIDKAVSKPDGGPSAALTMALVGMLPQVVGGLFGGAEGVVEGTKSGLSVMKDYSKNLQKEQEIALKQQELEYKRKHPLTAAQIATQKRHEATLGLEQAKQIRLTKNTFKAAPEVKDIIKSNASLRKLNVLLEGNNPATQGIISNTLAKGIAGEVGNISEKEREYLSARHGWLNKTEDEIVDFFAGKSSKGRISDLMAFIEDYRRENKAYMRSHISNFAKGRSEIESFGISKARFKLELMQEYGVGASRASVEKLKKRKAELEAKKRQGR